LDNVHHMSENYKPALEGITRLSTDLGAQ